MQLEFHSTISPTIFIGAHQKMVTMVNLNACYNSAMRSWHLVPKITYSIQKIFKTFLFTRSLLQAEYQHDQGPWASCGNIRCHVEITCIS